MMFRKQQQTGPACERASSEKKVRRRPLLKSIGATGIATSAAIIAGTANATEASAAPACCSLAHPSGPNHVSYSYCFAHQDYIWYCSTSGGVHCSCCETKNNAKSAADCRYN